MNVTCLVALPRSGSTPVGFWLEQTLPKNTQYLNELFNPNFAGVKEAGRSEFELVNHDHWVEPQRRALAKPFDDIVVARCERILQSQNAYLLKYFPGLLPDDLEKTLLEKSKLLFLRRERHFDHLLSWVLSTQTQKWYSSGPHSYHEKVRVKWGVFVEFCHMLLKFQRLQAHYSSAQTLSFESVIQDQRNIFRSKKTSIENNLRYIENAEEVVSWYRNSFMQGASPISLPRIGGPFVQS